MKAVNNCFPEYLSTEEIRDPYAVITEFYLLYAIDDIKAVIQNWMYSIYTPPNWNKESPGNLLYFYEHLLKLIEACWLIKKTETSRRLANISQMADTAEEKETALLDPALYCPVFFLDAPWAFFPRSLSWSEYLRPYKVLHRFFKFRKLQEWKDILRDLLYKAFIGRTLHPDTEVVDLIGFKDHLDKLADATHLINVREYEWREGKVALKPQGEQGGHAMPVDLPDINGLG